MASGTGITRSDIGAWIFKGNPDQEWDYFAARDDQGLRSGRKAPSQDWSIGTNYRAQLVEPKDLVVLWISGKKDPGVHQLGVVSGPIVEDVINDEFLVNEHRRGRREWFAPFNSYLLPRPIPRSVIKSHPVLGASEVIRAPQMGNPTYFSPPELDALRKLIDQKDLKAAGWSSGQS